MIKINWKKKVKFKVYKLFLCTKSDIFNRKMRTHQLPLANVLVPLHVLLHHLQTVLGDEILAHDGQLLHVTWHLLDVGDEGVDVPVVLPLRVFQLRPGRHQHRVNLQVHTWSRTVMLAKTYKNFWMKLNSIY